jgi:hypothetical protein
MALRDGEDVPVAIAVRRVVVARGQLRGMAMRLDAPVDTGELEPDADAIVSARKAIRFACSCTAILLNHMPKNTVVAAAPTAWTSWWRA